MKNIRRTLLLIMVSVAVYSCNTNTGKVELSPEMQDFVNMFDGKYTGVTNAIQKYAASTDIPTQDMDTKDLSKPSVTAKSEENGNTCYTISTNDGIKDCIYSICWKDKKIISITDITQ